VACKHLSENSQAAVVPQQEAEGEVAGIILKDAYVFVKHYMQWFWNSSSKQFINKYISFIYSQGVNVLAGYDATGTGSTINVGHLDI